MAILDFNKHSEDYLFNYLIFKSNYRRISTLENLELEYEKYATFCKLSKKTIETKEHSIIDNSDTNQFDKQFIYCSFHIGPYKIVIDFLCNKGINLVLLIGDEFYTEESNRIKAQYEKKRLSGEIGDLQLLNISKRASFIQLKSFVQNGYSIITYLDGHLPTEKENLTVSTIDFFNTKIHVKNGILKLAEIFNLPLTTIYAIWENQDIVIHTEDSISIENVQQLNPDISMQSIFNILYKQIIITPNQWEGWLYCNSWYLNKISNTINLTSIKNTDYELAKFDEKRFLFHFDQQRFFELDQQQFSYLKKELK